MAEAMQYMSQSNRRKEHRTQTEGDRALERFLRFHPPQYYGKPRSEQEAETWVEQIEDIFAALHYGDQRKVQFASFRLQGPARDWWLQKKGEYEIARRKWTWTEFVAAFRKQFIP
jgi:hypothetical protein